VINSVTNFRKRNLVSVGSCRLKLSMQCFRRLLIMTSYYLISIFAFVARLDIMLKIVC